MVPSSYCLNISPPISAPRKRKASILLTPNLIEAMKLLVSKRGACGVHSDNTFLFARPDSSPSSLFHGAATIRVLSSLFTQSAQNISAPSAFASTWPGSSRSLTLITMTFVVLPHFWAATYVLTGLIIGCQQQRQCRQCRR